MSSYRLVVMPHWRHEVDDIIRTLRESTSRARVRVISPARALATIGSGQQTSQAVLFSDRDYSKLFKFVPSSAVHGQVFRLWWNGADEIKAFVRDSTGTASVPNTTHVCFFPDVAEQLKQEGIDFFQVPYCFSRPRPPRPGRTIPRVCFTAEVDVSDACFAQLHSDHQTVRLSDVTWQIAKDVIGGHTSLVDADQILASEPNESLPLAHPVALWALRNRVRYLLVRALFGAFPGRMILRGSDWRRLGIPSRKTSRRITFSRARRLADYRNYRVSLDLGSKSTHAMLYPRSADIIAASGGIAQFHSGESAIGLPTLARRQAPDADALIELVDRLLTVDDATVRAENKLIQEEFDRMRRSTGNHLAEEIGRRCR